MYAYYFPKQKQVAVDKWSGRLSSCVSTSFPLTMLERDMSGSLKISPDQKVDCLELEGCKNPLWMKENESKYTWDLGILKVFSCFFHLKLAQFFLATMKTPNFQVRSFPTTLQASRCCHGIAISRCNSPYFKGAIWDSMIPWRIQPFQTTSNHLNIQFQPLKTSLTNRLDQSNLLKYTGDWWLFWNQFWDTASIIPFNSIRSHLKDSICVFVPPHHSRSLWRTLSTPLFGPPRHFHITVPFKGDVGDDPSCQKGNKWGKKMICKKALWKNRKALTLVTSTFHWG